MVAFCFLLSQEIFQVTVRAFGKLADDTSCPSYKKAVTVLDTVSRVRLSSVMLDLECDDLILNMFRQFLKVIRYYDKMIHLTLICCLLYANAKLMAILLCICFKTEPS